MISSFSIPLATIWSGAARAKSYGWGTKLLSRLLKWIRSRSRWTFVWQVNKNQEAHSWRARIVVRRPFRSQAGPQRRDAPNCRQNAPPGIEDRAASRDGGAELLNLRQKCPYDSFRNGSPSSSVASLPLTPARK